MKPSEFHVKGRLRKSKSISKVHLVLDRCSNALIMCLAKTHSTVIDSIDCNVPLRFASGLSTKASILADVVRHSLDALQ
eukprot:5003110-Amphidinium_carterae.2